MSYSSHLTGFLNGKTPQQIHAQELGGSSNGSPSSDQDGASTGQKAPRNFKRVPDLSLQGHGLFYLAPLKIDLDIAVIKQSISIRSSQTFVNNSDSEYTDVQFDLPLPAIFDATTLTYRIDDGDVVKKMTKLPKVVGAALPNVPPRSKIEVELTMYTILRIRGDDSSTSKLSFTVPSTFGRRYGLVNDWEDPEHIYVAKPGLTLNMEIYRGEYVTSVNSTSHALHIQRVPVQGEDDNGSEKILVRRIQLPTDYFGWLGRSLIIQIESIDDLEPPMTALPYRPPFAHKAASETSGSTPPRYSEDGTAAASATVADDLPGPSDGAGGPVEASDGNTSQEAQESEAGSHDAAVLGGSVLVKATRKASEGDTSQEAHVGSHDPAPLTGFPPVSFAAEASDGVTDQQVQEPDAAPHDAKLPIRSGPVRAPRGMLPLLSSPAPPLPVEAPPIPVGQQPLPQISGSAAAIVTTRHLTSEPESPGLCTGGSLHEMYEDMKKYLWVLLMFQRHDGSIHFENRAEAETILGQEIVDIIVEVEGTDSPDDRAYSTAVVTILHKNFAFVRDYWLCLHCKTMEYVDLQVRSGYLTRNISTSVGSLMPPVNHIVHSRRNGANLVNTEALQLPDSEQSVVASTPAESVADSQGTITPRGYLLTILPSHRATEQSAFDTDSEGQPED